MVEASILGPHIHQQSFLVSAYLFHGRILSTPTSSYYMRGDAKYFLTLCPSEASIQHATLQIQMPTPEGPEELSELVLLRHSRRELSREARLDLKRVER